MHDPNLSENPNHAAHDAFLIAGFAAGDLVDSERTRAQALLADCPSCAGLHTDLLAIAGATRALPNLAPAPRDFRLAPEQAARLRRRSWLRAALAPFGAARSATRPLAAAFTSLGVAGLLIGSALPGLVGGPAALAPERDNSLGAAAAPSQAPELHPQAGGPGASSELPDRAGYVSPSAVPVFGANDGGVKSTHDSAEVAGGLDKSADPVEDTFSQAEGLRSIVQPPNLLLLGSLALLALGMTLFGLRIAARRVR